MAFIENGKFSCYGNEWHPKWHPSIDEREIEYRYEKDGEYIPVTPCGFREYKESRLQGLKNIFDQDTSVDLTNGKLFNLKRDEGFIRQYDKIKSDKGEFVVVGDDKDEFYLVDKNNNLFIVDYLK